jgi:hypothetical protein
MNMKCVKYVQLTDIAQVFKSGIQASSDMCVCVRERESISALDKFEKEFVVNSLSKETASLDSLYPPFFSSHIPFPRNPRMKAQC